VARNAVGTYRHHDDGFEERSQLSLFSLRGDTWGPGFLKQFIARHCKRRANLIELHRHRLVLLWLGTRLAPTVIMMIASRSASRGLFVSMRGDTWGVGFLQQFLACHCKRRANRTSRTGQCLLRLVHSPPSLCHSWRRVCCPPVVVLGCGFSLPVCGFVRIFELN
jgi:hypothetical protein